MKSSFSSGGREIVFSAVRSYGFDCLQPFLKSLLDVGYKGEVCFFVDDVSQDTISKLEAYNVRVIPFKSLQLSIPFRNRNVYFYKMFPGLINSYRSLQLKKKKTNSIKADSQYAARFLPVTHSRFALWRNYLHEKREQFDNVLLTDCRDVIFQKHPFDWDLDNKVHFFQESEKVKIKECRFNGPWIKTAFGEKMLTEIGDHPISCAGVTLGTTDAVLDYLDKMTEYLTIPEKCHKDGGSGLDQGVHNMLVYKGKIKHFKLHQNELGPVLTMGQMDEEDFLENESGCLINKDKSIPHILHQYDRFPNILERQLAQYNLNPDIMLDWKPKWKIFG